MNFLTVNKEDIVFVLTSSKEIKSNNLINVNTKKLVLYWISLAERRKVFLLAAKIRINQLKRDREREKFGVFFSLHFLTNKLKFQSINMVRVVGS